MQVLAKGPGKSLRALRGQEMGRSSNHSGGRTDFFGVVSRRRLLKISLGGGSLLLMGGAGSFYALRTLRGSAPYVSGLRILTPHEYRTLTALAETHLPRGGPFNVGAGDFDLARIFDNYLADEPQENIRDIKRALLLVEYGPLYIDHRLATFSNLSPDERLRHWRSWMASDKLLRRQIALAFRKFLSMVFYDQEKVWPHIGYNGPSARELFG